MGHVTVAFWKPYGVLTKFTDDAGRPTLADHLDIPRLYAAGRLDRDSEGLLILSTDPQLRGGLTETGHPRTYLVQVEGIPDEPALERLRNGVTVQGRRTHPAKARVLDQPPPLAPRDPPIRIRASIPDTWVELVLTEGRNRQVRRMTAAVGYPTLRLVRWAVGPVTLTGLDPGTHRRLDEGEVALLQRLVDTSRRRRKG